jgi:hypothetical protein
MKPRVVGGPSGPRAMRAKQYDSGGHLRFKRGKDTKMIKIFNRKFAAALLAAAMALTLVVGFGAPAFATADDEITVTVAFYDGVIDSETEWLSEEIVIDPDTFDYDYPANYFPPLPAEVPNYVYWGPYILGYVHPPTVIDATWQVFRNQYTEEYSQVLWDTLFHDSTGLIEIVGGGLDKAFDLGTYVDDYLAPTPTYDGYWQGDAWLFEVLDEYGNVVYAADPYPAAVGYYPTNLILEDGWTINWVYTYGIDIDIEYIP